LLVYTNHPPGEILLYKAGTFLQTEQDTTWSTDRKLNFIRSRVLYTTLHVEQCLFSIMKILLLDCTTESYT